MPAVLNAANEIVVSAFLEGTLKFTEMPLFLQRVMGEHEVRTVHTVEDILKADHWARERSKAILERGKPCY
jgi:1-deoxy-D-xylulose-5-phosphate reductoisomerase